MTQHNFVTMWPEQTFNCWQVRLASATIKPHVAFDLQVPVHPFLLKESAVHATRQCYSIMATCVNYAECLIYTMGEQVFLFMVVLALCADCTLYFRNDKISWAEAFWIVEPAPTNTHKPKIAELLSDFRVLNIVSVACQTFFVKLKSFSWIKGRQL